MVERLEMRTKDLFQEKIRMLGELFPNCVIESRERERTILEVDFDALRQELSDHVIEGPKERYQFTWPDKNKATVLAKTPTTMTLRPCREESVDFDNTKNLYIEGDNLEVLKILRETYLGKVKMIYIDPPYNTGNDFVYNDDFSISAEEYSKRSGDVSDLGDRLVQNTNSNGRIHTDWLNMIYPRLSIAKDLLSEDGIIIISIDDSEVDNLIKISNESKLFSEFNHIATFVVSSNSTKNNAKYVSVSHEYAVCYAKNLSKLDAEWKVKKNNVDEYVKRANQLVARNLSYDQIHEELLELVKYPRFYDFDHYTYADKRGIYQTNDPGGVSNGNMITEIIHPVTGKPCAKPSGGWRYKDEEIKMKVARNEFEFGPDETTIPRPKRYLQDYLTQIPKSVLFFDSQSSTKWLKKNGLPFDFPKSIDLIKYFISMVPETNLIMDFFSGSATTAHAVLQLNAEDGGNRNFILVQIPERTDERSEAYKSGYKNICEIGKERIRRAGIEIKEKNPLVDVGFRVFKCDSSNMRDVFYTPDGIVRNSLEDYAEVIKNDRGPEDLLIQVMLELGIELSSKIELREIDRHAVFSVDDGYLVACFDDSIDDSTVTEISKEMSGCMYAVFRSGSSMSDGMLANIEQIFKTYSPQTKIRIL